jgi:phage gp37-like protein
LTIAGQVDVLDINQLNGSETSSAVNELFQGSLRYQLRDPQTSKVLLDVQQPLPEQALPLAFSHTLEIPQTARPV